MALIACLASIAISTNLKSNAFAEIGKITLKQEIQQVKLYTPSDGSALTFNETDWTSTLKNDGREFDVLAVSDKAEPCDNKKAYKLAGFGWACASELTQLKDIKTKTQMDNLGSNYQNAIKTGNAVKPVKEEQVDKYKTIKNLVNTDDSQRITSEKRSFVKLSRQYINRIHCDGTITKAIYPDDKGMQISNEQHDIFVKFDAMAPERTIVDLYVICDGKTFEMNAAVDVDMASQKIFLVGGAEGFKKDVSEYQEAIEKAKSMPQEEKIGKMIKRIYNDDMLQYWDVREIHKADGEYVLSRIINTNIGIKVRDYVAPIGIDTDKVIADLKDRFSRETFIGVGIADIPNTGNARVFYLTKE